MCSCYKKLQYQISHFTNYVSTSNHLKENHNFHVMGYANISQPNEKGVTYFHFSKYASVVENYITLLKIKASMCPLFNMALVKEREYSL